jgi:hypothetical protein
VRLDVCGDEEFAPDVLRVRQWRDQADDFAAWRTGRGIVLEDCRDWQLVMDGVAMAEALAWVAAELQADREEHAGPA